VSGSKDWRPHKFLPLATLGDAQAPLQLPAVVSASGADRYQREVNHGYREGHEAGLRSGFDAGLAEGRAAGQRAGAEEGRLEALQRFEAVAAPVDALLTELTNLRNEYLAALRREVIELVAKVAREVVRTELQLNPEQLLSLVDETLAGMPRVLKKDIEVHLNPQDLERLRALGTKAAARWKLTADEGLEVGECRVRAGSREADAGCAQRLAACVAQLSTQLLPEAATPPQCA
jgi:flagellar assembly protein FliH